MSKYGDIQYLIDRPEPSEIFLKARSIAGRQLQSQFNILNKEIVNSSYDGFKWIKAELTYPSFDNLTFAFKNSIFSVVIELIDKSGSSFTQQQKKRLLEACEENNLNACLFKIALREKSENLLENIINDANLEEYELMPLQEGWNLYNPLNNNSINPHIISTNELTKMSYWELSNFAIQIVRNDIEKEGNEVLSFCDLTEINPQIWIKDKKGNVSWIIVKHILTDNDLDYRNWVGLEEKSSQLLLFDGFFASVQIMSSKTNSMTELFRGDPMIINYKGIERIYVS